MSLYKRKNSPFWWVKFDLAGKTIRTSAGTTSQRKAREFELELKHAYWQKRKLGITGDKQWEEACERWLEETTKRSIDKDKEIIRWSLGHLRGLRLLEISKDQLADMRASKARAASKATANRYMALIRAILRACVDWDWLPSAPKVPMFRLERKDPRWLTHDQFGALYALLPRHQAVLAHFAVCTGLRQRNVSLLEWSRVDMSRRCAWVAASAAKGKRSIAVPLSAEAMSILEGQRDQHDQYVFTYGGEPVWQVNTKAWRKAVENAGIAPFRWHDLRHTWASWHVQAGTPLHVLQELGGWSSLAQVQIYAHLAPAHLAQYAEALGRVRKPQLRLVQ